MCAADSTLSMCKIHAVVFTIYLIISLMDSTQQGVVGENTKDTVERLAKMIEEGLANAYNYKVPSDDSLYEPTDDEVTAIGSCDFVIIGGGTTGAVIASRLSENINYTVCLIEAGKWADYDFLQLISYVFPATHSEYSWTSTSVPQTTACLGRINQSCPISQGRGLGGSTLINGAIYNHADPAIFKKWVKITKDPSWSYENVLPFYKRSENFNHKNPWTHIDKDYHGTEGPLNLEQVLPPDELTGAFLAANEELGVKVADCNGPYNQVASVIQLYTKNGRRQDTSAAFLKPVSHRSNLKVLTESYVTKINIDRNTKVAKGVTFMHHSKIFYVEANNEVILSAGAFSSPKILMLSGIGPKKHLKEKHIDVIADLEVGSKLTDDVICSSLVFSSKLYTTTQTQKEKIEDFLHGIGPLTSPTSSQGIGWYKSRGNKNDTLSDYELIFQVNAPSELEIKLSNWEPETYRAAWGNTTNAIQITLILVNPLSRGSVRLKNNSPFDFPSIDFKYFSDVESKDIDVMYEGIRFIFELLETKPFKRFKLKYEGRPIPGCREHKFLSGKYWKCFIRHTNMAGYHATGTCPMGSDRRKGAVVDSNLKVFGIHRLRVADSSVFPTTTARHPSGTCLMMGEKVSAIVSAQYS